MIETVGLLEFSSIAKGIEAADAGLKAAHVELVFSKTVCPGKYNLLYTGEVSAVKAALEAGEQVGGIYLVDSVLIPRVHPQVISSIYQATEPDLHGAVGIIEFYSVAGAVYAADAAVKAAEVTLLDIRLGIGIGGKSVVILMGEVAAVTEAVHAGCAVGIDKGMLVSKVVIPNPRPEILGSLL